MPKTPFTVWEDKQHRGRNPYRKHYVIFVEAGGERIAIATIQAERFPSLDKIQMEIGVTYHPARVKTGGTIVTEDRRSTITQITIDDRPYCKNARHDDGEPMPCRICLENGIAPTCDDGRHPATKYRYVKPLHAERDSTERVCEVSCHKHAVGDGWCDIPALCTQCGRRYSSQEKRAGFTKCEHCEPPFGKKEKPHARRRPR